MKPFKITNFTKAMLCVRGRKISTSLMREILITHILYYTRKDETMTEGQIYDEIKKVWNMPEDKLIRKFNRAMI